MLRLMIRLFFCTVLYTLLIEPQCLFYIQYYSFCSVTCYSTAYKSHANKNKVIKLELPLTISLNVVMYVLYIIPHLVTNSFNSLVAGMVVKQGVSLL